MVDEMSAVEAGGPSTQGLPNLFARLVMVFFSPGRLFELLKRTPKWLGAFLLVVVLASAPTTWLQPEEMVREQITQSLPDDASAEDVERIEGVADFFASPAGRTLNTGIAAVVVAVIMLAYVGVIMLVFNVFMGGEATFKQLFSFTAHSSLISSVGALVSVPLKFLKEDMKAGMNLGLLSPTDSGFLDNFLTGIDIFAIWATIVLAIGLSKLYPNRSVAGIAVILFIIFGLVVAVGAALAPAG